uniref:Uncharacterized protein n=1 Tax=Cacopsylla melanoneura TaxID=428564 RepID=A0A8D8RDV6_9HEMI
MITDVAMPRSVMVVTPSVPLASISRTRQCVTPSLCASWGSARGPFVLRTGWNRASVYPVPRIPLPKPASCAVNCPEKTSPAYPHSYGTHPRTTYLTCTRSPGHPVTITTGTATCSRSVERWIPLDRWQHCASCSYRMKVSTLSRSGRWNIGTTPVSCSSPFF